MGNGFNSLRSHKLHEDSKMLVNRPEGMGGENHPRSTSLSSCCTSSHMTLLWRAGRFGTPSSKWSSRATWVLWTHRVRWLNPTVLNVNALARSRTWVKMTPIASSNSVSFCRTGEVSISCRSVFGSCSYREIEIN